jgi:probable rRNA maturation factor
MINVMVADPFAEQVDAQKLELAAIATLQSEIEALVPDLSIVIEDDAHLQELNRQFLGIDAPTDVLSFPSGEEEPNPETGRVYIGDVIISYPRAAEQAEAAGHTVMAEIQLLVVHGVLHLLGYDHAVLDEKEQMWVAQAEILDTLGVQINRLPE